MSDDEPAPLPRAEIVDRETSYDKAARLGLAIVGAVFTMWSELLLVFCAGVVAEAAAARRIDLVVVLAALAVPLLWFVLARRIVRPELLRTRVKSRWVEYPSTSWAHAVLDLGYATLGLLLIVPPPAARWAGLACVSVTGTLFVLRLVYWRRQRTLD